MAPWTTDFCFNSYTPTTASPVLQSISLCVLPIKKRFREAEKSRSLFYQLFKLSTIFSRNTFPFICNIYSLYPYILYHTFIQRVFVRNNVLYNDERLLHAQKSVTFRLVRQHLSVTEIAESALWSPCHGYVRHSTLLLVINLYNLSKKYFAMSWLCTS